MAKVDITKERRKGHGIHANKAVIVRGSDEQLKRWRAAAVRVGMTFSDWARQVLDDAADRR